MKKFERIDVGFIDTPIECLGNISKYFNKANIYVKRDDMTGLALGGNKTRKLDYIVKYALDNGYTTLLTYGAPQTNHGRLTIAAAAKFGLKSILVCEGSKPQEMNGNLILDRMMDARLVFVENNGLSAKEYVSFKNECVRKITYKFEKSGEKVLEIPMGGSSALGSYGYMQCVKELIEQLKDADLKIDHLFCGYGSMGTYAGLWLGAKYYNADFDVIGIPVFPTPFAYDQCAKLINELAEMLEIDIRCTEADLRIEGGSTNNLYAGPAYGKSNPDIREAMYLMASKEALITDPCYTGKVVYGMFEMIKNDLIAKDANVMFLHTGGSPALFAQPHVSDMNDELWHDDIFEF